MHRGVKNNPKKRIQGGPKPRTSELKHVTRKNVHMNYLLFCTSLLQLYQSSTQIEHFLDPLCNYEMWHNQAKIAYLGSPVKYSIQMYQFLHRSGILLVTHNFLNTVTKDFLYDCYVKRKKLCSFSLSYPMNLPTTTLKIVN